MITDFLSYFDGLMLGDGSITKSKRGINYRYVHGCKTLNKEWLEYIKEIFEYEGIKSNISLHKEPCKYINSWGTMNSNGSYLLQSHACDFFTEQEKRWYVNDYNVDEYKIYYWHKDENGEWYARKKIVPKDIKLTPECVANWHMGDGHIRISASSYGQIQLATNSFTKEEVEFLSFLLEDHVVEETRIYKTKSGNYVINITKKSISRAFLDYIRPCVEQVSCFNYKIPEVS